MTVKEVCALLADVKSIRLGYNGLADEFNKDDTLAMAAYGKFIVDKIFAGGDGVFELDIAIQPMIKE